MWWGGEAETNSKCAYRGLVDDYSKCACTGFSFNLNALGGGGASYQIGGIQNVGGFI